MFIYLNSYQYFEVNNGVLF